MDIITVRDLDKSLVERILDDAESIASGKTKPDLHGKILATLFFEPSTRTKLSFQSAALRNGMNYIDLEPELSSLKKGESFSDTIRIVSGYADVLAIRHPKEGTARLAADLVENPVINCGDGGNQHPTQALIDLFTIRKHKGRLTNLNVMLFGDLRHARAMRSLLYFLGMFGAKVILSSPPGLEMEDSYLEELKTKFNLKVKTTTKPDFAEVDVLYVCRVQQERFSDPYEAKKAMELFTIRKEDLRGAKEDLIILHPLPRLSEIDIAIDEMPQAKYFDQARNGVPVRQAVLQCLLKK